MKYLLALDQGTTSSRAIVYDGRCRPVATAQQEFHQHFPQPGWVEHDAGEIWKSVRATAREAVSSAGITAADLAGIGITNQRETIVVWDRRTGHPIAPAIVWQDRRTADHMTALREAGQEALVQNRTGLLLDPYFSASKLHWLLRAVPGARQRATAGELAAGTIDSWLIWNLTGGREHVTDVTNASRTMLMDIRSGGWDDELLALFDIPKAILPRIAPSSGDFGTCDPALLGTAVPIHGVAGDQQAALFGQLCTDPGLVKCTYGTGCFMLLFTGPDAVPSRSRLLTTVAWQIGNAPMQYALEGSVFVGGAAIQWLRDGLGIIKSAPEVNDLAARVPDSGGVVIVPAFAGLGAPWWDPSARGSLFGITRGTTGAHIARATLESIAWEVADVLGAMQKDSGRRITALRVDGGASASDLLMQMQADALGVRIERPRNVETTALGAAMMAGLGAGLWKNSDELATVRETDRTFICATTAKDRRAKLKIWRKAVKRARNWTEES
ncbi:MAG: glycerol kinase GlpK [Chthoniobacterales bacterium]|nr:glycerol kinase GlpK [Chthoniobacterales bacterium]